MTTGDHSTQDSTGSASPSRPPAAEESHSPGDRLTRRDLLRGAAVVGGAAALAGFALQAAPAAAPAGTRYRKLGRTGLSVSEIGFGGLPLNDPEVLVYALDRGINYVDTSHCYRRGGSESAIGKALKGRRERFVVTTKWCPHHSGQPAKKEVFLAQLDESLRRLGTDYVDIVLNHEVGRNSDGRGVARLKDEEMLAAFATAKQAGKVRFLGASGHDGDLMEVMGHAVDCGNFDVILCRYSFLDYPDQQRLIARAHAQGVGFIAMKTLAGAKGADLRSYRGGGTTIKQAALKWVLSNRELSNLIISIASRGQVDEYAAASGQVLAAADEELLAAYAADYSREVCRFCNACEPACDYGLPIRRLLVKAHSALA